MDRNIQKRITEAVDSLCNGNKSEFCRRIGRPAQAIKDIIGGKQSMPGFDLIYDILSSDLGISPSWLILGEGEMLGKNPNPSTPRECQNDIHHCATVNINYVDLKEAIKQAIKESKQ